MLLRRMEEIQLTPQMDCFLERKPAQSNYVTRLLELQHINRENQVRRAVCTVQVVTSHLIVHTCATIIMTSDTTCQKLLRRLDGVHSVFNSSKWEQERKNMEKRIREMSEFDSKGQPKGFSAGVSSMKVGRPPPIVYGALRCV